MITFRARAAHFLVFELYKKINYWSKDCLMTTEWKNREADTLKRYFIYLKTPSKLFLPHTAENTIKGPNFLYSPQIISYFWQWWIHTAKFCFSEICFHIPSIPLLIISFFWYGFITEHIAYIVVYIKRTREIFPYFLLMTNFQSFPWTINY